MTLQISNSSWTIRNWHWEYNPRLERYTQSDPLGLVAGINPYHIMQLSYDANGNRTSKVVMTDI